MKTYPRVLTVAGSDSGGGAGIQADIKSISATGSYAASAITAVTVQNTLGVEAVHPVPTETIVAQVRAVLSDIGADAVKIGMLHSAEVVLAVRDALLQARSEGWLPEPFNIVLDPVMVATSGHRLIEESAITVLRNELLPLARVITPNIPEAEILIGRRITSQNDLPAAARELSAKASKARLSSRDGMAGYVAERPSGIDVAGSVDHLSERTSVLGGAGSTDHLPERTSGVGGAGLADHLPERTSGVGGAGLADNLAGRPVSVLMKAGHLTDNRLVDVFYNAEDDRIVELPSARIDTPNTHGTGCTLSSAFASFLAQGLGLDAAARAATEYIHDAIASGSHYSIGHGHGPVDHFFRFR